MQQGIKKREQKVLYVSIQIDSVCFQWPKFPYIKYLFNNHEEMVKFRFSFALLRVMALEFFFFRTPDPMSVIMKKW